MKRKMLAVVLPFAAFAMPAAPAQAQTCAPGQSSACAQLVECRFLGAVLFLSTPPADLVPYYRNCLNLDRRYRVGSIANGQTLNRRRRRIGTTRSTFWPLYCEARRRAGMPPDRICKIKSPAASPGYSTGGGGGGGGGGSGSQPHFTG